MILLVVTPKTLADPTAPAYLGSQACAGCHQEAFTAWQDSHHALAMQHANEQSVLGDFDDASFTYAGTETHFATRGERYFVTTDDDDGELAEFEIAYTFGVEPLQQYLVSFEDGRLQALSIAWDTRPAGEGGQRWFHLHPDEAITHEDDLHWTRPAQNWNHMCADCHSTDLRKGYDSVTDTFDTSWSEISVGCEACHGPGSHHVRWAQGDEALADQGLTVRFSRSSSLAAPTRPALSPGERQAEQPLCARCHAFRSQIAEGYRPGDDWLDYYRPELLVTPFYHSDGQQREEVFTWASFAQSRMHAEGVTCSNCHEPHSQRLRVSGNALCTSCHTPSTYDHPEHHFHPQDTPGSQCVQCHMPSTTYMVVDPRRDHSLRIPRPDLTESLGTPNACNTCHDDRSPRWAQEHLERWHAEPTPGHQDFTTGFAKARRGIPGVGQMLMDMLADNGRPEVVRASAAAHLMNLDVDLDLQSLEEGLESSSPLVRHASLTLLEAAPPDLRRARAAPLLTDTSRLVRSEAARLLIDVDLPQASRSAFEAALAEYEQELALHADRADSRNRLALLRWQQGQPEEALEELRAALRLDRRHVASHVNLADMLRALDREQEAVQQLAEGVAGRPESAALRYALGLARIRLGQPEAAREELGAAHRLAPDDLRYAYGYAVAVAPDAPEQALAILKQALEATPYNQQLLWALATYSLEYRGPDQALPYARRLAELTPDDSRVQRLLEAIEATKVPP
ncbi:cytochrome c3 family protein [Halomonas sp. HK25]|uniref:cytochrome c3 family protein n=1 Tax=Halomonas sp. HK25 TaxID=3394321 RepID=UPI0039FCD9E3